MNTGTSRASPARKSGFICSRSRSRSHSGSAEFDQRRAELVAEHRLDLGRGGGRDRHGRFFAGAHQHRLADDADAHALERAGAPEARAWRA